MDELIKDLRFGVRSLMKHRGFTLVAVLTLGLGIGANTAIFSVISGVLLKPLPYGDGDRLVLIRQSAPRIGRPDVGVSIKELYDYREQANAFDELVEYHQMSFDLLKRGDPNRVNTGVVSHNFFDVLGIRPIMGRTFVANDDVPGADAVLVLRPTDPLTLAIVVIAFVVTGTLACLGPAWRATTVDPMVALRAE